MYICPAFTRKRGNICSLSLFLVHNLLYVIEQKIARLLEEKFEEEAFQDCFLIDVAAQKGNKVLVFIDSDSNVTFEKCQKISRYLEKHIDEQGWLGEKYVLEVSSPGISRPLQQFRQYPKNIGRTLEVKLKDGSKTKGILTNATPDQITLEQTVTVKEGKKKKKEKLQTDIAFNDITKAIVKITF